MSTEKEIKNFVNLQEEQPYDNFDAIQMYQSENNKWQRFGSWRQGVTFEQIESYLYSMQRKFKKYPFNIFVLNRAALKIQHSFFKKRRIEKIQVVKDLENKIEELKWRIKEERSSLIMKRENSN